MRIRRRLIGIAVTFLTWLGAGCASGPPKETVLGEAYVGPATLRLRLDLTSKTPDGETLRHGQRLEIIGRRRVFVKVRTAGGAVGWTLSRQLLSSRQMQELNELAERAAAMPSHGLATVYEPLNVHTEPNRQAPSFHQIREGEQVEVLAQRVAPRVPYQSPALLPPTAQPEPLAGSKARPKADLPPVPLPPAPPPPPNWLELSWSPRETRAERAARPPRRAPVDTWALVRLKSGRAGWALARMLRMEIPDEVAQYSEGHRITSYFSMGQVKARGQIKHNWLWTTIGPGDQACDFDSFRYFVWNARRNRYETAYVERNLKGFFPVSVHPVEVTLGRQTQTWPGFSVIVQEADGVLYRRTYAYQVYLVRRVSKTPWLPENSRQAARPVSP